jgi:hypothetical protein
MELKIINPLKKLESLREMEQHNVRDYSEIVSMDSRSSQLFSSEYIFNYNIRFLAPRVLLKSDVIHSNPSLVVALCPGTSTKLWSRLKSPIEYRPVAGTVPVSVLANVSTGTGIG